MSNQRFFIVAEQMNMPKNNLQTEWQEVVREHTNRIFDSVEALNNFWAEMSEVYAELRDKHKRCKSTPFRDQVYAKKYRFMGVMGVGTWQVYKEKEVTNG